MLEAKFLYCIDWYDGPLTGGCELEGKRYWAIYSCDDTDGHRIYDLKDLSEAQWAEEDEKIRCFREYVGEGYISNGTASIKDPDLHRKFYDVYTFVKLSKMFKDFTKAPTHSRRLVSC